jgi:hypothetical protein
MAKVILGSEPVPAAPKQSRHALADLLVPVMFAFGLAIAAVATVDLGLVWIPFRFGSGEWEFGTVSQAMNAMPLLTMGLVFLTMAGLLAASAVMLRVLSLVHLFITLALIGAGLLYALNVPVALGAVPPEAKSLLQRAILRTSAFAGIYTLLFGWLSWFTWRRAGAATRGVV